MKQWELARYLIDAKKCVDSVLYIADNAEKLRYFGLKELVDEKRNTFYINCCAVIDHTIATKTKDKKDLCAQDSIAELLYRERDKNSAHKDEDYIPQEFDKLIQIAEQMKAQLIHIADLCKEYIPSHLGSLLFLIVYAINTGITYLVCLAYPMIWLMIVIAVAYLALVIFFAVKIRDN